MPSLDNQQNQQKSQEIRMYHACYMSVIIYFLSSTMKSILTLCVCEGGGVLKHDFQLYLVTI